MEVRGRSNLRSVQYKGKHCNQVHEFYTPFYSIILHASTILNLVLIFQGHLPVGIMMRCFLINIQNWIFITLQESYKLPF